MTEILYIEYCLILTQSHPLKLIDRKTRQQKDFQKIYCFKMNNFLFGNKCSYLFSFLKFLYFTRAVKSVEWK
jgi:hypothetical protein